MTRSPGLQAAADHVVVADHFAERHRLLARHEPLLRGSATNTKCCPAIRFTARTGTVSAGSRLQIDPRAHVLHHAQSRRHAGAAWP